jgi:hypothetical protein
MARSLAVVLVLGGMLLGSVYLLGQGGLVRRSLLTAAALCGGPFAFVGGIIGWEWFLSDATARPVVERLSRTGARFFYAALGVGLTAFGAWALRSGWYLGQVR